MVSLALEHLKKMFGMNQIEINAYTKNVIDNATTVFGVYVVDGVADMHIVKGKRDFDVTTGRIDAIPCGSLEQAFWAEDMYGDGKPWTH